MVKPTYDDAPTAPTRNSPTTFRTRMDAFLAWMPGFKTFVDASNTHVDSQLTAAETARDKAEEWADKAEDSEVDTGQFSAKHHAAKAEGSATAASDSADAAAISESNAEGFKDSAQTAASAAGAAAGLPALAGNGGKFLRANDAEDGVEFDDAGQKIGDILMTTRSSAIDGYLDLDGSVYLKSAYPDLAAIIGKAGVNPTIEVAQVSTGIGNRQSNISDAGDIAVFADSSSPYFAAYSRTGTTWSAMTVSNPGSGMQGAAVDPTGSFCVSVFSTGDIVRFSERTGSTFGAWYNPSGSALSIALEIAWSPDGNYVAVSTNLSPYFAVYQRSGSTFTRLSNPATLPSTYGRSLSWSSDGSMLCVGSDTELNIYSISGSSVTHEVELLSTLNTEPSYSNIKLSVLGGSIAFHPTENLLFAGMEDNTQMLFGWEYTGTAFTPVSLNIHNRFHEPNNSVAGIDISQDGSLMIMCTVQDEIYAYWLDEKNFTPLQLPVKSNSTEFVSIDQNGEYAVFSQEDFNGYIVRLKDFDLSTEFMAPAVKSGGFRTLIKAE